MKRNRGTPCDISSDSGAAPGSSPPNIRTRPRGSSPDRMQAGQPCGPTSVATALQMVMGACWHHPHLRGASIC